MPLFVVETIQTFRHRYVIEGEELDHAFDTVTMEEATEFSQMYLGEQIVTGREISKKEFKKMIEALEKYGDGTKNQPEHGSPYLHDKLIYKIKYDV